MHHKKKKRNLSPNTGTQLQRFFLRLWVGTVPFGATADSEACAETADCSVRAEVCGLRICTRYDRLSQQQLSFLLNIVLIIADIAWTHFYQARRGQNPRFVVGIFWSHLP